MSDIIKKALQNLAFINGKPCGEPMEWLIVDPDLLFDNGKEEIITIKQWFGRYDNWKQLFLSGYAFNTVKHCDEQAIASAIGFESWASLHELHLTGNTMTALTLKPTPVSKLSKVNYVALYSQLSIIQLDDACIALMKKQMADNEPFNGHTDSTLMRLVGPILRANEIEPAFFFYPGHKVWVLTAKDREGNLIDFPLSMEVLMAEAVN
ncbi:MAG: hypothetical protein HRU38_11045 [Saccharospirillaceae bacterium]|nr:hypothetical protein [Saccharospirillaceae bacterium]